MNAYQKLKHDRAERKFSTGDGVRLPDGRVGTIRSIGGIDDRHPDKGCRYDVRVTPQAAESGQEAWETAFEADLASEPQANTGKYGGPSRDSSPGGWDGVNRYRER